MAIDQNVTRSEQPSFSLEDLYCEEEKWGDEDDVTSIPKSHVSGTEHHSSHVPPLLLLEQDLFWEDEELLCLFSKEKETHLASPNIENDPFLSAARREAVE